MDEKDKSETNNTITNERQNEETPKEVTANCESGGNKIADYTPLTLDEKTKSDEHENNEEFESNFHSVNDANKSENKSMRTNIHSQREDEIQSYQQHVSKSKKENENNAESNLQVIENLEKSKSDAIARQVNFNSILLINFSPL